MGRAGRCFLSTPRNENQSSVSPYSALLSSPPGISSSTASSLSHHSSVRVPPTPRTERGPWPWLSLSGKLSPEARTSEPLPESLGPSSRYQGRVASAPPPPLSPDLEVLSASIAASRSAFMFWRSAAWAGTERSISRSAWFASVDSISAAPAAALRCLSHIRTTTTISARMTTSSRTVRMSLNIRPSA